MWVPILVYVPRDGQEWTAVVQCAHRLALSIKSVSLRRYVHAVPVSLVFLCVHKRCVNKVLAITEGRVRYQIPVPVHPVGSIPTAQPPFVHRLVATEVDASDRMLVGVRLNGQGQIVVYPNVNKHAKTVDCV